MSQSPIILYHNERVAGAIRIKKIMALKDIAWKSCRLGAEGDGKASGLPLDLLLAGAMGHPVLQRKDTFWVSTLAVIDALEELYPEPTLFPNGNRGMPLALTWWSEDFRLQVEPYQIAGFAALIKRQLADGRDFLQGPAPGLADIQAFAGLRSVLLEREDQPLAMIEAEAATLKMESIDIGDPADDAVLARWLERVEALGEGGRQEMDFQAAREEAKNDNRSGQEGPIVILERRSPLRNQDSLIRGRLVAANQDRITIEIPDPRIGTATLHFPLLGYRLSPA